MDTELTPQFRQRVEATRMTHSAIAAAMGLTRQYFSQVWNAETPPSTRFMTGAVGAGLANHFGEVAHPATITQKKTA